MSNGKYIDPVFQEIKVKSANNRKIIFEGEVTDEECLKTCYFLDKLMEHDRTATLENNWSGSTKL